jgi:hypothetical protein
VRAEVLRLVAAASLACAAAAPASVAQDAFCQALIGVIEAGPEGFAALREEPQGRETWTGQTTLPGTEGCVIEGDAWPRARYECAGPADQHARAAGHFARLSGRIDACLGAIWQRHAALEFAMGERQQTWTDRSTAPPSAVVLKLQRGLSGDDYRVRLDLVTIR